MPHSTEPNPPPKPTDSRAAFRFGALSAISSTVAAAATIWVGMSAENISRQQVAISSSKRRSIWRQTWHHS